MKINFYKKIPIDIVLLLMVLLIFIYFWIR